MQRVVVLGRGGAGDPGPGREPGDRAARGGAGCPWTEDLQPLAREAWGRLQEELATGDRWVMDGDLGPYDDLSVRLRRADTVLVLDLPLLVCAWRAARRSRERADFWW